MLSSDFVEPKFRHHAETLALARLMHYLAGAVPMPDLSEGDCVGSDYADNWHADIHRQMNARQAATFVCFQCPVQSDCGEYALAPGNEGLSGVWGGMWERDREEIRRGERRRPWLRPDHTAYH